MNWPNIFTIFRKELRDSLRDRRTLMSMIVVPTLVMPLLFFGVGVIMTKVVRKAQAENPTVMILGGGDSPGIVARVRDDKRVQVVPAAENWRQLISDKKVRAAVEIPAGFEAGLVTGSAPAITIYTYEGEMKSGFGAGQLERIFRELHDATVAARLEERGVPQSVIRPFAVKRSNVAPAEKVGGNLIGGFIPYLIIILCFTGAMYPAMDLTAGEKERGTMETLLCSPVGRVDIVLGKFLMVLTASIATMAMSLLSTAATFVFAGTYFASRMPGGGGAPKIGGVVPLLDPLGILGVFTMILPVAVLFSAVLLAVALFAKSFKEAQSYVSPLIFVVLMPAMVGLLPGIELSAGLALVPILNLSLVCKEMLSGVWHWSYIALIFGSSCLYAAAALWFAVRMFNREDVIFRT